MSAFRSRVIGVFILIISQGCTVVPGFDVSMDHASVGAPTSLGGFDFEKVTALNVAEINSVSERVEEEAFIPGLVSSRMNENAVGSKGREEYKVGVGDVLSIIVWDHPELTSPTGEFREPESSGRLVDSYGRIFYPYVGEVAVSGLSISQIRRLISARLARVVRDPQVDVRIVSFRSQKVRVTGEVEAPAIVPITDRPLTVLDAISAAGGLTQYANRYEVTLIREGIEISIPLRLGNRGLQAFSDLPLKDGDIVHAPNSDENSVYLLGSVGSQQALPLARRSISLAEALSSANGLDAQVADRSRIFVVRAPVDRRGQNSIRATVYQVEMSGVHDLMVAQRFLLFPQDIVYVDRTGLASYNSVVSQILPSVSTLFQLDRLIGSE